MRRAPAHGMTLLELMVVVALLGVLTTLSATALEPLVGRYRQQTAAEAVAQVLALARMEARQQGRCYRVQILASGVPVAPGTSGDAIHVVRRADADCETATPVLQPDARFFDVRLPAGVVALVPVGSSVPEFRPNGYTQDELDTEIQVGPAGAPATRISIRSFGPVCAGPVAPPRPCP